MNLFSGTVIDNEVCEDYQWKAHERKGKWKKNMSKPSFIKQSSKLNKPAGLGNYVGMKNKHNLLIGIKLSN